MAIEFVGSTWSSTTSPTPPAHQAGDLLVAVAFRDTSAGLIEIPSGWTSVKEVARAYIRQRIVVRFATASDTAGGTWTGANAGVLIAVYRNVKEVGASGQGQANNGTWVSPALSLTDTTGTSWVLTSAHGYPNATVSPLAGTTAVAGATNNIYVGDTRSGVSSWAGGSAMLVPERNWTSVSVELVAIDERQTASTESIGTLTIAGANEKTVDRSGAAGLSMSATGSVVRSEGPIKPTTGATSLGPLAVSGGVVSDRSTSSTVGLTLGLTTGGTVKAGKTAGSSPLPLPVAGAVKKTVTRAGALALSLLIGGDVRRVEDNLTGLLTRLVAYKPNGESLGPLPGSQSWDVTIPYGADHGAISLNYPRIGPRSDLLKQPVELALEVHDGQKFVEPMDCRWLTLNASYDELDPNTVFDISGVSMGVRLDKTVVFDGPTDGGTVGERRFTSATVGRIMTTLIGEAVARGALQGVDVSSFSLTTDSAGNPWSLVYSIGFTVGLPLSKVVEALIQQGMMEMRWQGRKLLLFDVETSSVDRSLPLMGPPVTLRVGRDLKSAEVRSTIAETASVAIVRGDGGVSVEVGDPALVSPWGRWETVLDQGGVDTLDALEESGSQVLSMVGVGRSEHTHALNFIGAQFLPFRSYRPGDWVNSIVNDSASLARYRVRQLTLSYGTDGIVSGSVILNDLLLEADVKIKRRMDGVQGGATNNAPRPKPIDGDKTVPNPPTNLAATTSVYMDGKRPLAQVKLTWTNPTKNTDNSNLDDLQFIQLWAKPSRVGTTWRLLTTAKAGEQVVTYEPLEVAQTYSFRATAIDFTGHVSEDSNTVTIAMASDTTAPPTPAAPTTQSRNGIVEISFNGQDAVGQSMPIDFSHVEVYAGGTAAFVPSTATLQGTIDNGKSVLTLAKWPYSQMIYAKLIAVDVSGNKSAISAASGGTVNSPVGSGDLGSNSVGSDALNVPAIDSSGNLRVNQLDGKTINGVTINGGSFATTAGTTGSIVIGAFGVSDSVDEIQFWNNGTKATLRKASGTYNTLRASFYGGVLDIIPAGISNGSSGRLILSTGTIESRDYSTGTFQSFTGSAFVVSSKLRVKKDVEKQTFDTDDVLGKNGAHRWKRKIVDDDGKEQKTPEDAPTEIGLIADYLPDELRVGEGYSVTAVVAFLWDALKESNERIARLESERKPIKGEVVAQEVAIPDYPEKNDKKEKP